MSKIVYAVMQKNEILEIIDAQSLKEAQAKLEAAIARDYMKRHGIALVRMSKKEGDNVRVQE